MMYTKDSGKDYAQRVLDRIRSDFEFYKKDGNVSGVRDLLYDVNNLNSSKWGKDGSLKREIESLYNEIDSYVTDMDCDRD